MEIACDVIARQISLAAPVEAGMPAVPDPYELEQMALGMLVALERDGLLRERAVVTGPASVWKAVRAAPAFIFCRRSPR